MSGPLRYCYVIFSLAIGGVIWALSYGFALQALYGDGRILRATITKNPFAPFLQLAAYSDSPVLRTVALGAVLPALLGAGAVAYAGLHSQSAPLGDAHFQDAPLLRRGKWFQRRGHVLGRFGHRILRTDDDRHHLVIGPTRSGKGVGYVIPNALMHQGSMIVTDLKGEIFRSTAGYRKSRGNQVFLFAPGSDRTHRYNPLDFIRPDRGDRTTDIQNIASLLIPEHVGSENAIWQATAQQVMAGVISYVTESICYEGRRNLAGVTSFFNSGTNIQTLMATIRDQEPSLSRFTVQSFNSYLALSERTAASALLDVQKALQPFRNERIAAATSVTDMDFRAMRHRPVSVYLAPNVTDIVLLKPLLSLFIQQALDTFMLEQASGTVPVYFLLDEFRQLKKMSEITTKLPYVAGYGIKMAFIVQDLKALDEVYGETSRHSLMGNCAYQLAFGANDSVTAESISRGLGKRTVRYTTESRTLELIGIHRRTRVEHLAERDLMMPQEIRRMPPHKMIILPEGQGPILADKLRFYTTAEFSDPEKLSRSNIPFPPTIEFLPEAGIPAVSIAFKAMGKGNSEDKPKLASACASPANLPDLLQPDTHHQAPRMASGQDTASGMPVSIETRFEKASRRLQKLVRDKTMSHRSDAQSEFVSAVLDTIAPEAADGRADEQ